MSQVIYTPDTKELFVITSKQKKPVNIFASEIYQNETTLQSYLQERKEAGFEIYSYIRYVINTLPKEEYEVNVRIQEVIEKKIDKTDNSPCCN